MAVVILNEPSPTPRVWFTVAIKIGCSSRALTDNIYEMAAPCFPDHRWVGWREWFRFFAERSDDYAQLGQLDQADRIQTRLDHSAHLLEYTMEPAPQPTIVAIAA